MDARPIWMIPFLLVGLAAPSAAQWDSTTTALLSRSDTDAALAHLREYAHANDTPQGWCALGELLTAVATPRQDSWRIRHEAYEAFVRGLEGGDVACLYAYALLKEKQGTRVDAMRVLNRVEARLAGDSAGGSPVMQAELLYRRALLMDDWLRNFDYLVDLPATLQVSTPDCVVAGFFCENFRRPRMFNERFLNAPPLASVTADDRRNVVQLLDSALALDPRNADAERLRLRRALVANDWDGFAMLARRWAQADPMSVASRLAVLAAEVHGGAYQEGSQTLAVIDSLIPDSLRTAFERFVVISRSVEPQRAEEVWALSDPLYLTPANERRVQLYARLALADIMFTDPGSGLAGRDTQPGKLLLRYGWPAHIWEVVRDRSHETDPITMSLVQDFLASGGETWIPWTSPEGGGRWTFFNYDLDLPSFVFERNLSERDLHYQLMTQTEQLDSTLARVLPSSYDSPYRAGSLSALVTRFPRPAQPMLEVHARFSWDSTASKADSVDVGVFVHERLHGRLVNRGTTTRQGLGSVTYGAILPVVAGPLQVAVEGLAPGTSTAAQERTNLDMTAPGAMALSDLLLGEFSGEAGDVNRRTDIRLVGRTDTLPAPGSDLTVYWETYGLQPAADSTVRYTVTVQWSETAGGRTPGGEVVRVLGHVMGLRSEGGTIRWERQRRLGNAGYAADVVTLRLPSGEGSYRLLVTVHDDVAGTSETSERGLTLRNNEAGG